MRLTFRDCNIEIDGYYVTIERHNESEKYRIDEISYMVSNSSPAQMAFNGHNLELLRFIMDEYFKNSDREIINYNFFINIGANKNIYKKVWC